MPFEVSTEELSNIAKSLSSNPNAWLAIGGVLYQWMTAPKPLSNHPTNKNEQDLVRYQRMCALYLHAGILKKKIIPVHWQLKDGCPTHYSELSGSAEYFRTRAAELRVSSYSMKTIIVSILSLIERLYESLSKRAYTPFEWKRYRPDGYEAMFFADLAQWLSSDLPAASITAQSTADMLQDRINYCKAVQDTVFIFRDDENINNPKDKLGRIIIKLETLHKDICKSIEAASFNHCIDEIGNNLLDMASNAFSVCHLIIEGVNQNELQVDEFLDPHRVDVRARALTQLMMGQWIKVTLQTLGITSNNFQSNGGPLELDTIATHLKHDYSQITLSSTGLHEFIKNNPKNKTRKEHEEFSHNILSKVINIHREILKIYYVKSSLIHAARVAVRLGESWLYGNEDGKLVVKALLAVIKDANEQFTAIIGDFWEAFYNEIYRPYANQRGIDYRDSTFAFLHTAGERVERIKTCHGTLNGLLSTLTEKAKKFANDAETTKEAKQVLINNLYEFLRRKSDVDENLMHSLGRLVEKENSNKSSGKCPEVNVTPVVIEPHIVRYPIDRFPIYQAVKHLLVDKAAVAVEDQVVKLMDRPASRSSVGNSEPRTFHTDLQQSIYDDILVPLHPIVNAGWLYSKFYSFITFSIDDLRDFYSRINTIMTALYEPKTLKRARPDIHRVVGVTQAQIEADASEEIPSDNLIDEEHIFYNLNKGSVTPWTTELMIVDQHLKIALYHFFRRFKNNSVYRPLSVHDQEILQIEPVGDNLEITVDKSLLTFSGGAFAIELEKVNKKLDAAEARNSELLRQNTVFGEELRGVNAELERAKSDLASRDEIIARLNEQMGEFRARLDGSGSSNRSRFFTSESSSQAANIGASNMPDNNSFG